MTGRGRVAADSLLTVLAPAIWGSTYLVTTEFLPPDRPFLAAMVRALPAGLLLLLFTRSLPSGVWWWRSLVLGTLNIGAFLYLLFVAAYLLPGGIAALVMSVQPVIVLLLGALLLRQAVRPAHLLACLLGAAGVGLLVVGPEAALDPVGVLAGLAAAVSMGTGIVLTKRWGRPAGVGLLGFTGWQLTAGGLVLLPATLVLEGLPASVTAVNLAGFAYLGLIGALLSYALWFRGLERLPALAVSFLSFASPLTATVLGFLVLDETLTPVQGIGALAAVGAVLLVQFTAHRPRPAAEPDGAPGSGARGTGGSGAPTARRPGAPEVAAR
ncbi:ABC transporter permease [Nocardiopsis terrae]|uniref:Blue pigment (Indigoidine) exporter n=1 Tax=Nocardiopsis terrae TaxID=372655 RepID=A0ABR9HMW2_9ACTN|nr:EamA family transporter [Nocardiopsis terrae]MBE1460374.1 putative blue pigment (indigoidine) exporter [Nocardiopsis terrae]GHC71115.1 ABC transporter permease [Nocardiopsis terrae]